MTPKHLPCRKGRRLASPERKFWHDGIRNLADLGSSWAAAVPREVKISQPATIATNAIETVIAIRTTNVRTALPPNCIHPSHEHCCTDFRSSHHIGSANFPIEVHQQLRF